MPQDLGKFTVEEGRMLVLFLALTPPFQSAYEEEEKSSTVESTDPVHSRDEWAVDSRLLLLMRHPESPPAWAERIKVRYVAVKHQLFHLMMGITVDTMGRDVLLCAVAWAFIAAIEGTSEASPATFYYLFDVVSCIGTVGLSFELPRKTLSKLALVGVMVVGRVRGN